MTTRLRISVGVAALLAMTGQLPFGVAAPFTVTTPDDFGTPSAAQLAESIHVWGQGEVHAWNPEGHVTSVVVESMEGGETVVSLDSDILFAFGSADMPASAAPRVAELMAELPDGQLVSVTGHTDDVGSVADNLTLSQQRADAVAAAAAAARPDLVFDVAGKGESEPVESNGEPEGREANRRVELRYGG